MKRVKQPDEAGVPSELRPLALANLRKELGETKNPSIDVRFVDDDVIANKAASLKQTCLPGNNGMDLFDPVTIQPTLSPGRFAHMDDSNNLFTDDSTRLVCHEAFRRVMFLTMQVKNLQDAMSRGTQATTTELAESLNHEEANLLLDRMIAAQSPHSNAASATIRRGMYPSIDELLDKMMGSLILHYRYLMDHCQDYEHFFLAEDATTRKRKAISNAIASKYTKDRTDYLYKWMDDRAHYPYPDANELELLSMGSGLQTNQVNNWATNIRKRKLKASVDLDKKPSDYLDFRFLAEHREKTNQPLLDNTKAKHIPIFVDKRDREQKANVADPTSEKKQGDEFEEKLEEANLDSFIEFQNGAEINLQQLHFEGEYADSTVALDTMTRTSTDHMLCMCDSSHSDSE